MQKSETIKLGRRKEDRSSKERKKKGKKVGKKGMERKEKRKTLTLALHLTLAFLILTPPTHHSIYFCKPKTTLKNKIFPEKEVELCVQIWGNLYDVLINEENHRMNSRV